MGTSSRYGGAASTRAAPVRLAVGLAILLAGAGCARYRPLPLPAEPTPLRAAAAASFPRGPLGFAQVGVLVLQRDPDLVAARRQRGVVQAQLLQAGLLPDPAFVGGILPLTAGPGSTFAWNASIQEDLRAVFTAPLRRRGARDAGLQVDAQLLWQEWQAVGQARLLYVQLVSGERALTVLRRTQAVFADRTARLQRALALGDVTLTTAGPDTAALQAVRAQVDALERQQLVRRHQLNALLDREADALLALAGDPPVAVDPAAVDAAAAGIARRRPDLIALRLGYRAQEARTRLAVLDQFPAFSFGVGGGSDNSNVRSVGPQFATTLPVFDRNRGDIALQRATRAQLRAEYQARLDAAYGQARAAATELRQAQAQLAAVRADLPAAQSAAAKAAAAFRIGALDELAYVDLISAGLNKELEIATLEQTVLEQQVVLATLTGASLPSVATLPDAAA